MESNRCHRCQPTFETRLTAYAHEGLARALLSGIDFSKPENKQTAMATFTCGTYGLCLKVMIGPASEADDDDSVVIGDAAEDDTDDAEAAPSPPQRQPKATQPCQCDDDRPRAKLNDIDLGGQR